MGKNSGWASLQWVYRNSLIKSDMTQQTHISFVLFAVYSFCEKKAYKELCELKIFKLTAQLPNTVIAESIYRERESGVSVPAE